jgi:diphosphomevalonate decarboxylase
MIKVHAHPSLALIKYWGKACPKNNLPATPSLAISLDAFTTTTTLTESDEDQLIVDETQVPNERISLFFDNLREKLGTSLHFSAESVNNFPTSAGLASSSSGFAALAFGSAKLAEKKAPLTTLSEIARLGSASAARAIFPGFVALKAKESSATPLFDENHWPKLNVIIAITKKSEKKISSREAMLLCQKTSPNYNAWVENSDDLFNQALEACKTCDLKALGPLMRKSTYEMFATMLSANPPILYWESDTLGLIKSCEHLRQQGLTLFETMDAGPQVKMLVLDHELNAALDYLKKAHPHIPFIVSKVGKGVS